MLDLGVIDGDDLVFQLRGVLISGACLAVALLAIPTGASGTNVSDATLVRLGGQSRYETAERISQAAFGGPMHEVWVTRGDLFADALAASYPAGQGGGAAILLTPTNELHDTVRREIDRLEAWRVWLAGDSTAIANSVEDELRSMGLEVVRVGGRDRYETAFFMARQYPGEYHLGTAIVATGGGFADAMAAGPLAFAHHMPVLLTTPDRLHPAAAEGLRDQIVEVIIVGGTSAVSDEVRRDIEAICFEGGRCLRTTRIGGRTRTETAALLADELVRRNRESSGPAWGPASVVLARGDAFPDALAAAPLGGVLRAPVLLTQNPTSLGEDARTWIERHATFIDTVYVLGSDDAISDDVAEEARRAASG